MIDRAILSSCIADRNVYERIKDIINKSDFSPEVGFWFEQLVSFYSRDKRSSRADVSILREFGKAAITNPKQADAVFSVLDSVDVEPSAPNVMSLVLDMRKRNLVLELAALNSTGDHKRSNKLFQELAEIWNKSDIEEKSELEYAKDWADLGTVVGSSNRISLGVPAIDGRIGGGVLPGHHILIFGRTEIGKSCLTVSTASNLLKCGQRVLYVGNEDSINILKFRMGCSLLGWTSAQMEKMPKKSARLLSELTQDRLTMVALTPGSVSELEDLTEKHAPTVLVVDQIRNLSSSADGMTQRLEENAIRFRSLLNKKRLIGISVTQAGDRSDRHNQDGPLYLSAGDVDSSRVGLPGTADLQLGIGCNQELLSRGLRMISFCKNKLYSGPNARDPLLVRFDLTTSRVFDGGN